MSAKAALIEFIATSRHDPRNGLLWAGAIVAFFVPGTATGKAVWLDRDKTLPTVAGQETTTLEADGAATVYGDGIYDIKIYDATDTKLTTPIKTYSSVNISDATVASNLTDPNFLDGVDDTKIASQDMSSISSGTERTFTFPDQSGTYVVSTAGAITENTTGTAAGLAETGAGGGTIKTKIVEIGDWNMDATASVSVAHGLDITKIRHISAIIRLDGGGNYIYSLTDGAFATGLVNGGIGITDSIYLNLFRFTGGGFDAPLFSSTSYNRGWVLIAYVV